MTSAIVGLLIPPLLGVVLWVAAWNTVKAVVKT